MYIFKEGYYADIRIEANKRTIISYENNELSELKETTNKRAFIRVYDGVQFYYCSTAIIDDVQKELDLLYLLAKKNDLILEDNTVKLFEINKDHISNFTDNKITEVPIDDKKILIKRYNDLIDSDLLTPNAVYSDHYYEKEFYSSLGSSIFYNYQHVGIFLSGYYNNDNKRELFHFSKRAMIFNDILNLEEKIRNTFSEYREFSKNYTSVKPGLYQVILSPQVAGVFAHESFGHKSEADFLLGNKKALKEWKINKVVGSKKLSIVDDGSNLNFGYCPYDDEGTKSKKTYLIKNGLLTGRLHSVSTASELAEVPTGNARAVTAKFEPIVRMTNTNILPGDKTFNQLLKKVKHGYFIKTLSYGTGLSKFTIAPVISYEIIDGKIGRPVKINVLTGDVFTTLHQILDVSNDYEISLGGCGKMEQSGLPVGTGGPYVLVKEMMIS